MTVLSWHPCPGSPFLSLLLRQSCSANPVPTVQFCLPCLPILFCLSYSAFPLLFCLSRSGCLVLTVLFCLSRNWMFCSACPIIPLLFGLFCVPILFSLSRFFCPARPVPFLSSPALPRSACPVLPVPFCLSCCIYIFRRTSAKGNWERKSTSAKHKDLENTSMKN
jgi:hypothetical protein